MLLIIVYAAAGLAVVVAAAVDLGFWLVELLEWSFGCSAFVPEKRYNS